MSAPTTTETDVADQTRALWTEFSAPLRGFLRARIRSDADAEDLLQEVFVRIQKRLPTLRDTSKIQGWVYRIARNAVVDHYRSASGDIPNELEIEEVGVAGEVAVDLRPALQRFIAELPAIYRDPLLRFEYHGESMEDVAKALGLSVTATKSRVRRARMMLRQMLDRCCRFQFDGRGRVIEATPRTECTC